MLKKRSLVSNTLHARRLLQTSSRKRLCPASCDMHPAKHSSKTEKRLSGEAEVSSFGRRLGRPTKVGRRNGRHHYSYRTAPVEVAPPSFHGPLRIAAHHSLRAALVVRYSFGLVAKPKTHCLRSSGKPSSLHAGVQAGGATRGGCWIGGQNVTTPELDDVLHCEQHQKVLLRSKTCICICSH